MQFPALLLCAIRFARSSEEYVVFLKKSSLTSPTRIEGKLRKMMGNESVESMEAGAFVVNATENQIPLIQKIIGVGLCIGHKSTLQA